MDVATIDAVLVIDLPAPTRVHGFRDREGQNAFVVSVPTADDGAVAIKR